MQNAIGFNFYANTRTYITGDYGYDAKKGYEDYGGINFHHGTSLYGVKENLNVKNGEIYKTGSYRNWGEQQKKAPEDINKTEPVTINAEQKKKTLEVIDNMTEIDIKPTIKR
ncbi:MAG: hypothetical protein HUJ68_03715 [Clostridia bacterium]|nr:hypothetical protein [Clostridia bacterium]